VRSGTRAVATIVVTLVVGWTAGSLWAAAPVGQYTVLGNGTVKDNKTGLVWQQHAEFGYTFSEAGPHCASLVLGGASSGWRVPTKLELESLVDVDIATPGPTVDSTAFPATDAGQYWTSRPSGYGGVAVQFVNGTSGSIDPTDRQWVRCVR
jgi:hypothetical protein